MPDFGFWAWPEARVGAYGDVRHRIATTDTVPFQEKTKKLVWRGYVWDYQPRLDLVEISEGYPWSDVAEFNFEDEDIEDEYLPIEDHCQYMFLAHTEGSTCSGRGKYLLNCHSVFVSHRLRWREPYHAALVSQGPDANHVEVAADFSDLPAKMEYLLRHPKIAERIADNSARIFRDRYLTPAAEACCWRQLIRLYASVSGFEPERRGIAFEDWVLTQESASSY